MNGLALMAMNMLQQRPDIANNPEAQEMINCIKSGDSVRGEQLARNLCEQHGEQPNDVIGKAKSFFRLK